MMKTGWMLKNIVSIFGKVPVGIQGTMEEQEVIQMIVK